MNGAGSVEVYIGELIEHASERVLLDGLLDYFRLRQVAAIIFMNFHVGGRQIDAAVITDNKFLVIEVKGYNNPVRGNSNGPWEVAVAGGWKKFSNPYRQTVNAANALRDAMRSFSGDDSGPYPSGALVFVPRIPDGSETFGDFKASVCGLAGLPDRIAAANTHTWPLERWRNFAAYHRLERMDHPEAAYSPKFYEAEKLLAGYGSAFRSTYGGACSDLEELSCLAGGRSLSSSDVTRQARNGDSIVLLGPSGCGKSLLALRVGVEMLDASCVPILLQAKDFAGRLKDALDHEVTLLDVASASELVRATNLLEAKPLLIVDGYNECAESLRELLTRSMLAFARRYQAQLLVTSQIGLVKPELLRLRQVSVPEPDAKLKAAVAAQGAGGTLLPGLDSLLSGISSCLEARLVGELRQGIAAEASRYALFDAYVRSRLGQDASEGIRILSRLAGEMATRLSFTLTVRERDRLVSDERDPAALLRILDRSNTLVQRGDRLSFRHELFFHAFTAEAVVRAASGQASRIVAALSRPIFSESKILIVGAIDDDGVTQQVLSGSGDQGLLLACRAGECGAFARHWIRQKVAELIPILRAEIERVDFAIGHGWDGVGFDPDTLHPWSPHQRGLLVVLSQALFDGEHLDAVFEAVQVLDQRIPDGVARLKGDPRLRKGVSIRSALFANAYTFAGAGSPGIAVVTSMGRSGGLSLDLRCPIPPSDRLLGWLRRDKLSHGQKYLLLHLSQGMQLPSEAYADALCTWLPSFRTYPQHLALEMLHQATFCGRIEEPQRSRLIEQLQALLSDTNPLLNSSVFEALEGLGALEDDAQAQLPGIKKEIAEILVDQDNPESWIKAYGLQVSCIDHPYSSAYCQAINELSEADRRTLLRLACIGAPDSSFTRSMLIWDVARCNDPRLASALARWTDLPVGDTAFQQDAVQVFVASNALTGRHNIPLQTWDTSADSAAAAAMRACGSLYYWVSRTDAEGTAGLANAAISAWSVLLNHEAGVGAYALYFCERRARYTDNLSGSPPIPYIGEHYPQQTAMICREALNRASIQKAYYPHDHHLNDMLRFCVDMLGRNGQASDIPFLRQLCDMEQLGRSAIEAIRQLER